MKRRSPAPARTTSSRVRRRSCTAARRASSRRCSPHMPRRRSAMRSMSSIGAARRRSSPASMRSKYGLVKPDGSGWKLAADPVPTEAFINYLSDHDYVLSVHAAHVVDEHLKTRYGAVAAADDARLVPRRRALAVRRRSHSTIRSPGAAMPRLRPRSGRSKRTSISASPRACARPGEAAAGIESAHIAPPLVI